MSNQNKEHLQAVLNKVLEDWSMMMVETPEPESINFTPEEPYYSATAKFSGNINGQITISCPVTFLNNLAHNLLCLDPDLEASEQELTDSLQELTNIVSGNFLTEAFGTEEEFDLPNFQINKISGNDIAKLNDEETVCFIGDEQPVFANCKIDLN